MGLRKLKTIEPDPDTVGLYHEIYSRWRGILMEELDRTGKVGDGG